MILKEPGNQKIHPLRVIHLFEASYNLILSTKWRHLPKRSELASLLNPGQFGGRAGHTSTHLTLLEELKTCQP